MRMTCTIDVVRMGMNCFTVISIFETPEREIPEYSIAQRSKQEKSCDFERTCESIFDEILKKKQSRIRSAKDEGCARMFGSYDDCRAVRRQIANDQMC